MFLKNNKEEKFFSLREKFRKDLNGKLKIEKAKLEKEGR